MFALALMILVPFVSCVDQGQIPMSRWLKQQDAVTYVQMACPDRGKGCTLSTRVTLAPDTSAQEAASIVDGALEKAIQDRHVTANSFHISLKWQYHSTQLHYDGPLVAPRSPEDGFSNRMLAPQARAQRLEALRTATDITADDIDQVTVSDRSIEVERGEVHTIPTSLLATRTFSDNLETMTLTDTFTLRGWRIKTISDTEAPPPSEAVNSLIRNTVEVSLPDGTNPLLELDTTEYSLIKNSEPRIKVWFLPKDDDDDLEIQSAAAVLATIEGTPYFADVELCAEHEYGSKTPLSCVSYEIENGRIGHSSRYPKERAQEIYDAAQQL
ncbi:hypothetical protein DRB06_02560 [Actinomyces sp. Z5]|nr:hypothetical protein DRB06_02560 [Actinomyces sp. Z5]